MSISLEQTQSTTWMYVHSVKTQKTQTHRQTWSFWRLRGNAVEWGGYGGGWRVVAVFLDNKWWDALVSARPTEPDDRRAAKRSCDHITHFGALWEGPLSSRKGVRSKRRRRGWLPMNPAVPVALFQLSCIQTNFFFFSFFFFLMGRASLPLFGHWPQLVNAFTTLFHNPIEQKLPRQQSNKSWQLGLQRI